MDDLRKKYGNDLRVVFKQFVVHPQVATAGALAVCAANKQGKFMQMDALLWDKGFKGRAFDKDASAEAGGQAQKCWESSAGCPVVLGYAQELGLNLDKFKADMKGDCQGVMQKDMRELQALGVAVVLHQRPVPVGRDADRQLLGADRRGAQEGQRRDPEGHAGGELLPAGDPRQGPQAARAPGAVNSLT
jgi:hypothetical protein